MSANIKPLIFFLTVCTTQYIYFSGDHFVRTLICMLLCPHCNSKVKMCQRPKRLRKELDGTVLPLSSLQNLWPD